MPDLRLKRSYAIPENEMYIIIKDTNTLLHNFVDSEVKEKDKEIERLNNIINELEKYFFNQVQLYGGGGTAQEYYDKLQELKGEDKE